MFCRTASAVPWYQSDALVRLLGGEDLDEAAAERVELVGVGDVPVQADGEELRQDVDAVAGRC